MRKDNTSVNGIVIRRADGRPVGVVVGGEYRRTLRPGHVLERPVPAVAVDVAVLDQAEAAGAQRMAFTLPDGWTAVMSVSDFRRMARLIDRGAGPQLAVPLGAFPRRVLADQLPLFEAV